MIRHAGQSPQFPGAVESGGLLVTSGIVAPETLDGVEVTFPQECGSALRQLAGVLAAAGRDLDDVLRVEAFLADASDVGAWNEAFATHWPDPARRPARTTLVVGFVMPSIRFEVQALVCGAAS